jgi:hypothetical protein
MECYRRDPLSWDVPVEFAYRFGVGIPSGQQQSNSSLKEGSSESGRDYWRNIAISPVTEL